MMKFGIQNGLNVARLGLTEDQILTACMLADKTGYNSVWYMDCLLYTSPSPRD